MGGRKQKGGEISVEKHSKGKEKMAELRGLEFNVDVKD